METVTSVVTPKSVKMSRVKIVDLVDLKSLQILAKSEVRMERYAQRIRSARAI